MSLTMLVPTRGRPGNLARLWQAFVDTCVESTMLVALVDNDDPELPGYQALADRLQDEPLFRMGIGPRLRLGPTLNVAAPKWALRSDAVGFLGDDHLPRTVGWDGRYLAALERLGTGLVYGNDRIQGQALPTQVAMTSDVIRELGYFVPPGIVHLFADNAWKALGEALGRITYLPDVIIEHLHPVAGKAPTDSGYAEANAPEVWTADQSTYEQWVRNDLPEAAERLRSLL